MAVNIRKIIWFSINLILLGIIIYLPLQYDNNLEENNCFINRIEYPTSFYDLQNWKDCQCGTNFCTNKCYCVKLFTSVKDDIVIQYERKNKIDNCTFESNIIPYNLNFNPIIDEFLNRTVGCWYSKDDTDLSDIYLNYKNNEYTEFFLFLSLFLFINLFCFLIELADQGSIKSNVNRREILDAGYSDEGIAL